MGECADAYLTYHDNSQIGIGIVGDEPAFKHGFEITTETMIEYSPEKELFIAVKNRFPTSIVRVFNVPAWHKYTDYQLSTVDHDTDLTDTKGKVEVRLNCNELMEAIKLICSACSVSPTKCHVVIQDMGCDLLLNETHLLIGNARYGLASYVEEMTLVLAMHTLLKNTFFDKSKVYLCAANLGGDLSCKMTESVLATYPVTSGVIEHFQWSIARNNVKFYVLSLDGINCGSIANASVITGLMVQLQSLDESNKRTQLDTLGFGVNIDKILEVLSHEHPDISNLFSALFGPIFHKVLETTNVFLTNLRM